MATEMNQALGYLRDASNTLSSAVNTTRSITDSIDLSQTMAFKVDQYLKDLDFEKEAKALQLRSYFDNTIQRDINNRMKYETLMDNTSRFNANYDLSLDKFNYDKQINQQNFDFNKQRYEDAKAYRDKVYDWNKQVYNQQLQAQKDALAQQQAKQQQAQQQQKQIQDYLNKLYDQKQQIEIAMQEAKDKGDTKTYIRLSSQLARIKQAIANNKGKVYNADLLNNNKKTKNTLTTLDIKSGINSGAINDRNIVEYIRQNPDSFKTLLKTGYDFNNNEVIRNTVNSYFNKETGDVSINKETEKYVNDIVNNMSGDAEGLATGSSIFGYWTNKFTGSKMFDISKIDKKKLSIKDKLYKAFESDIKNRNTIGNEPLSYHAIKEFSDNPRSFGFNENAFFEEPYILRDNIYTSARLFDPDMRFDGSVSLDKNVPMSRFKRYMKNSKNFTKYAKRAYLSYLSYLKGQSKDGRVYIKDKNNKPKLVSVEKIKPLVGAYIYYNYFN